MLEAVLQVEGSSLIPRLWLCFPQNLRLCSFLLLLEFANRSNLVHHGCLEHHQICWVIHPQWQVGYSATEVATELFCSWPYLRISAFWVIQIFGQCDILYPKIQRNLPALVYFNGKRCKVSNLTFTLERMFWYALNPWTHKTLPVYQVFVSSYGLSFVSMHMSC